MQFCMRCHKRGELVEVVNQVRVCKGCMFRITEIANFFEHFGWGFNKRLEEIVEVQVPANDSQTDENGRTAIKKAPAKV